MRNLLVVPVLMLALVGCGANQITPGKAPTGVQASLATLKQACPDIAEAVLGTSPASVEQLQALADNLDGIAAGGGAKVKNAVGSIPVHLRAFAADVNSADLAKTYASDAADLATTCAANGAPFRNS